MNDIEQMSLWKDEGFSYAERNKKSGSFVNNTENMVQIIRDYGLSPQRILDVGCSYGNTLQAFKAEFQSEQLFGVEPSDKVVEVASQMFPDIHFQEASAHALPFDTHFFDLVVVSSVFSWCFRDLFLQSLGEVFRVSRGHILVADFAPQTTYSTPYSHLAEEGLRTWKHDDLAIFNALPQVAVKRVFYTTMQTRGYSENPPKNATDWDRWRYILLEKQAPLQAYPNRVELDFKS